jgi:hypothetical protein
LVSVLMARSDCTPPSPSSSRTPAPSSTSALIVTAPTQSLTSADLTNVNDRVDELNQRHKRAYRSLFALLALFAGFAFGIAYFVVWKLNPASPGAAAAPLASAATAAPLPIELAPNAAPASQSLEAAATPAAASAGSVKRALASQHAATRAVTASSQPAAAAEPVAPPVATQVVEASPSAPSPSFGFLTIDTSPWSLVSVGGKVLGQTPLVGVKLPSGTQVLSLKNHELGIETTYSVTIEAGKTSARRIGIE